MGETLPWTLVVSTAFIEGYCTHFRIDNYMNFISQKSVPENALTFSYECSSSISIFEVYSLAVTIK